MATTVGPEHQHGGNPEETHAERLDRELNELLQELRVLLPGTTVLLGFLLSVAFSRALDGTAGAQRTLFAIAFMSTALAVVLLVAPGVRHRTRFRDRDKERLLRSANWLTLGAAALLAVSLGTVTTLVGQRIYGWAAAYALGGAVLALSLWFWFAWGARRHAGDGLDESERADRRS